MNAWISAAVLPTHRAATRPPMPSNFVRATRTTPAHVVDIVPTLLELAGLEPATEWKGEKLPPAPGRSLIPAFAKDATVERDSLWWLHEGNRAVRVGDWKLVAAKGEPWELYDLKTDRAEQNNLASKMPDKVKELEAEWAKWNQGNIPPLGGAGAGEKKKKKGKD